MIGMVTQMFLYFCLFFNLHCEGVLVLFLSSMLLVFVSFLCSLGCIPFTLQKDIRWYIATKLLLRLFFVFPCGTL